MNSVSLAVLAFLCPLLGAAVGMVARTRLPEHHLSRESTDVIKLATGLVATLVALVLSLLISSANSVRVTVENEYKVALADVVLLDRYLAAYGPQSGEVRGELRDAFAQIFSRRFPGDDFGVRDKSLTGDRNQFVEIERRILALVPANAEQKWFQSQALQLASALSQIHRLALSQEVSSAPPWAVLIVVLLCSAFIFAGFGLFVPPNMTVVFSFAIAALAVAAAIFLIVDLGDPFTGFLNMSSAPAHATLSQLGK
jgi:Protein of unknown function (DUF4239)